MNDSTRKLICSTASREGKGEPEPGVVLEGERTTTGPSGHHILIADDEETFRRTTAELLTADGYRVSEAVDGEQARVLLEREQFDLVIADLKMPGNANLALVRAVKRLSPGIHVILVTGFPSISSAIAAYDLPVAAYLIKPFDYRLLLAHVRQVLRGQDRDRERERLEQRLRREQERFRELFLAIPDAVLSIDRNGCITAVNRRTEELFGYCGYELVGAPLDLLLPERFRPEHRNWVRAYLERPHRRPMGSGLDITARHRSGREIPVDILLSPVGEGAQMEVLTIIRPIRELERADRDLRERCEEQARQLRRQQRELAAVRKGLAHLEEMVEREVVPSLESMLAELELLAAGSPLPREERLRERAGELGHALRLLIEQARLAGKRLQREELDLSAMACEILSSTQRGGDIALSVWEGARAFADPLLVRSLLEELLDWARGHAGERPGSRVEFGHLRGREGAVFRVVTQRHQPGHGCEGLAGPRLQRCREVVRLHGGRLWRLEGRQAPGCGYAFTLGPPGRPEGEHQRQEEGEDDERKDRDEH